MIQLTRDVVVEIVRKVVGAAGFEPAAPCAQGRFMVVSAENA